MEAEAILSVIALCETGQFELLSSEVLIFETKHIPNIVRRENILEILTLTKKVIMVNNDIENHAINIMRKGIKPLDALHLATASHEPADYFCTSDAMLLKKQRKLRE